MDKLNSRELVEPLKIMNKANKTDEFQTSLACFIGLRLKVITLMSPLIYKVSLSLKGSFSGEFYSRKDLIILQPKSCTINSGHDIKGLYEFLAHFKLLLSSIEKFCVLRKQTKMKSDILISNCSLIKMQTDVSLSMQTFNSKHNENSTN